MLQITKKKHICINLMEAVENNSVLFTQFLWNGLNGLRYEYPNVPQQYFCDPGMIKNFMTPPIQNEKCFN